MIDPTVNTYRYLQFRTFDVDAEAESAPPVRVQGLVMNNVGATLQMLGQLDVEGIQHFAGSSELIMAEKKILV